MRLLSKYRNYLLFLVAIASSINSYATHIIGGEIYYDCLGNNNYKITLKLYRDCNSTTPFDNYACIGFFDSSGTLIDTVMSPFPGSTHIPVYLNNPCIDPPTNICVEEAVYTSTVNLPPIPGGYSIVYQRCCRNGGIINISNPGNAGATYISHIPDTSTVVCNSSPRFNYFPPVAICAGVPLTFDHSASDPDGDSLVYSFYRPLIGGTTTAPMPQPPNPPPYSTVIWNPGYSDAYQIDASPAFTINPHTGILQGTPTTNGRYVIGICVKEYRNGVFLSETRRDFQFNVSNCIIHVLAAIASQSIFCSGLTVQFHNNSNNGSHYFWDFGDTNTANDTSTQYAPSYTYSDTGTYTIMLVAFDTSSCTDTTYNTFSIHKSFSTHFDPPPPECITQNSFDFTAGGSFDSTLATYHWDFGSGGNPDSSSDKNPQNVSFDSIGAWPVTLTITQTGCSESYTDTVKLEKLPVFGVYTDTLIGCQPFGVLFHDTTKSDSPLLYDWDFGDGSTSYYANPFHEFTQSGTFNVSVKIKTTEGCIDSSTIFNTITVYPKPKASYSVSPKEKSIFEPVFNFSNSATNITLCVLNFGDESFDTLCIPQENHTYADTGYFYTNQIVTNQFGCKDTLTIPIYVKPEFVFFIPNAFTPDGDGLNDIFIPKMMAVKTYEFEIFNRWGQLIFHTSQQKQGWNGINSSGKYCAVGVYVYLVKLTDVFGQEHQYVGKVALVR